MTANQPGRTGDDGAHELVEVTSQWGLVSFVFTVRASGTPIAVDSIGEFLGLAPSRTYASDSADTPDTWAYACEGRTPDESATVFRALVTELSAREAGLGELKRAGTSLDLDIFGYGHTGSAFTIDAADLTVIARLGFRLTVAVSDSAR